MNKKLCTQSGGSDSDYLKSKPLAKDRNFKINEVSCDSSLPVEQSTKFEFAINLKTAKALNLTTIPPNVLRRAIG
jgi:hypothetical protein